MVVVVVVVVLCKIVCKYTYMHVQKCLYSYEIWSFQGAKESVAIFHTLSDTSSNRESSSTEGETSMMVESMEASTKAKAKAPMEDDDNSSSSEEGFFGRGYRSVSERLFISSSDGDQEEKSKVKTTVKSLEEGESENVQKNLSSTWLKRRKTSSSTN